MRTRITRIAIVLLAVFAAIQLIPYGRDHTNPPSVLEPGWDSPATRILAQKACFDCHSNETVWPAYANVAPVSWLVQRDVDEGRAMLNFSEWQRPQDEAGEAAKAVEEGEMPPAQYLLMHSAAKLSAADRDRLVQGLVRTVGPSSPED